jgi:pyruvate dehydrogenase E1 component alpha subunit
MTYRQRGHSRSDPATYRPAGELERWLERDPIVRLEAALAAAGVARERLAGVRAEAARAVATALERALAYPDPDPASRFDHVFA